MTIDIEATKRKEAFIQAELYRILQNSVERAHYQIEGNVATKEVLVEATLKSSKEDAKNKIKEADLVLMLNLSGRFYPLLVIEIKKRVEGSPTKTSQKALRQAHNYSKQIGCKFYAIYDGNVFVLMQTGFPYLIGLKTFNIHTDEYKSRFAGDIWYAASELRKKTVSEPMESFRDYSVFLHWRKTLRVIVRDAHRRLVEDAGSTVPDGADERIIEQVMKIWQAAR